MRRFASCLLAGFLLAALPAAASDDPNNSRGFSADNLYQFGELDTVDLFNGNLTLVVPLGGSYPVNAGFSYGLTLTYNSNVWDFAQREGAVQNDGTRPTYTVARPGLQFNAGLGWKVSLGELLAPNTTRNPSPRHVYVGVDGGSHAFWSTLHEGESQVDGWRYSRDGSYLRLELTAGDQMAGYLVATLEQPGGMKHRFSRNSTSNPFALAWMEDRFGNRLTVTDTSSQWTLSDGHRTHTVHFVTKTSDGRSIQMVDRVELAAFGGTTATYQFNYDDTFTTERHDSDTDPNTSANVTSPVLTSVSLPDGFSWGMPTYYSTNAEGPGMLGRVELPTGGQLDYEYGKYQYIIRSFAPAGGRIGISENYGVVRKRMLNLAGNCFAVGEVGCEWTYTPQSDTGQATEHRTTTVTTPNASSGQVDKVVHHFNEEFTLDLASDKGWRYGLPMHPTASSGGRHLSQEIYSGSTKVREIWVEYERDELVDSDNPAVWYDRNRRVKSRETVYKDDEDPNNSGEYRYRREIYSDFDGLGHHRQRTATSDFPGGSTRTSRTEYNDGNGSYTVNLSTNSVSGGYQEWPRSTPWIVSTFTEKSQSEDGATAKQQFCFDGSKGVVTRQRTLKGASSGTDDVLMVYERDTTTGNVIHQRTYGGDTGSLGTGAVCSTATGTEQYRRDISYSYGSVSEAKWVNASGGLVLYTHRSTNDANTGFPADVTAANGLVTSFDYDTSGRLTSELPTVASTRGARTTYTYSPATSNSLADVLIRTYTNDGSILLTKSEIDFDDFGRPWRDKRVEPNGQWSTVVTTTNAMGWKHSVTERQFGTPDRQTVFKEFDPFGRPGRITPPDGAIHQVSLTYAGDREVTRNYTVCAAQDGCLPDGTAPQEGDLTLSNATVTGTESYEVLGTIDAGPSYTVAGTGDLSLASGEQVVLKNGFSVASGGRLSVAVDPNLGTGANGETAYQHVERSDKHGRLYQVREPSGDGGAMVTTTYSYDVGNRLSQASTTSAGVTQTRLFDYDHRGFLTSERHPEKGSTGNGSVTYSGYDPLGNPGKKVDGSFDLRYAYDRAGRLTDIDEWIGSATRPLKVFEYETFNSGSDLRGGQLWKADRYNYTTNNGSAVTVRVQETYTYTGRDGAVSGRDTQTWVNGTAREAFTQGFNWRHLGNLNFLDYPECTHTWCATPEPRRVRFEFDPQNREFLASVQEITTGGTVLTDYATAFTYHPNGMPATTTHGNGVVDNQDLDAEMARPDRIWTTGASSNWDSGEYVYDGAGNISAIGNQRFSYDGVSRLTRAQIGTAQVEGGSTLTRTYTHDAFGNLETIGALTPPVDSSTNRLTGTGYDAAGNVINSNGTLFEYDALGMVSKRIAANGADEWIFIYTADDERLWTFSPSRPSRWTIRDLNGQVLRDYRSESVNGTSVWTVDRDYIHANGRLLAAEAPSDPSGDTTYHYHPDHLGTPRLITDQTGTKTAYHAYYPFGEEATYWNQDSERMKFTVHERDFYDPAGDGDDLDYQHARYCDPSTGRYNSPDPVMGEERRPQSWNRNTYALGNPLKWTDPTGEVVSLASLTDEQQKEVLEGLKEFTGNTYSLDDSGNLVLEEVGAESSKTATTFFKNAIASKKTFSIKANNGDRNVILGQGNVATNTAIIDFDDFSGIRYGDVDRRTLGVGAVVTHELIHARLGLRDPRPSSADTETGPVVHIVNRIRSERGLPIRGPAYSGYIGILGRVNFNFQNVKAKKPERIHYVRVRNR